MIKNKQVPSNKPEYPHCSQNTTAIEGRLFCGMCLKSRKFKTPKSIYSHYVQFHTDDYRLPKYVEDLQIISNQISRGVLK